MMHWWNDINRAKLKYSWFHITASLHSVNCDSTFTLTNTRKILLQSHNFSSNFTKKDHFAKTDHLPINSVFMDFWTNKNKYRKVEFKCHKKDCSVKRGLWYTAVFSVSILYFYHTRKEKPCSQVCSKLLVYECGCKKLKYTESLCSNWQTQNGRL